jgi:serine/threonine protein kinase
MTEQAMASRVLADRYRLQGVLATSLMAEVQLATDDVLDRPVVVKLLAADADRARFEREARAVAALAHANVVQLFDYGEDEGCPYMVFEYLPAESLQERLAAGALADAETARISGDIAAGLAQAHEQGVVHRDLKPGNVLFDAEGRAKIADFGIAHVAGADTITDAGTMLGTAAYISPEQVRGDTATPASDVYAFGVVLYQMLAGRPPFAAENPTELAAMHRDVGPPAHVRRTRRGPCRGSNPCHAGGPSPQAAPADSPPRRVLAHRSAHGGRPQRGRSNRPREFRSGGSCPHGPIELDKYPSVHVDDPADVHSVDVVPDAAE